MANTGGKKPFWNLSVYITSLSTEKPVEVNGETFVGKLMLDLVEGLGKLARYLVFLESFSKPKKYKLIGCGVY